MERIHPDAVRTFSVAFLALMGLGVLLHITRSFTVPFAIAVFLAYLLSPAAEAMTRLKVPPLVANTLVILGVCLVLTGLLMMVLGALGSVTASLPRYMQKYRAYLDGLAAFMRANLDTDLLVDFEDVRVEDVFSFISPSYIMKTVNKGIGTAVTFVSQLTLTMLFLMFMLFSRRVFVSKIYEFLDIRQGGSGDGAAAIASVTRQVQAYLLLKTVISLVTGLVFGLVAFLFGLDFALIWGILAFLLNFIPTVGPILASIPPIFLAVLQFDSVGYVVAASVCLSAVQFISGSFVEPLIMGDRLNLNIVAILLSLMLWGLIWGIPGMILSVPLTAALNILFRNVESLRNVSVLLSK